MQASVVVACGLIALQHADPPRPGTGTHVPLHWHSCLAVPAGKSLNHRFLTEAVPSLKTSFACQRISLGIRLEILNVSLRKCFPISFLGMKGDNFPIGFSLTPGFGSGCLHGQKLG